MNHNPNALPPGTVIAGYQLVRVLGEGGFGITYEAHSPLIGRRVAIKEFFPRGIASRGDATRLVYSSNDRDVVSWALDRFERTTADLCQLRHPNIIEVIHYIKENETGYMIMEHVEGTTLESWLNDRHGPPGPADLRPFVEPILGALEYVHGHGIIHRDVAPDNIMIRPDGRPVLIDFGAMKMIEKRTTVRPSFIVTKRNYAPPEQTEHDGKLAPTIDIYAMGAVLYRAFAGRPPADAEERKSGIAFRATDPYVPLAQAAPGTLSPRLIETIDRAMAFRADRRPQSVAQLGAGLDWSDDAVGPTLARGAAGTVPQRGASAVAPAAPVAKPRWRARLAVGLATLAVIGSAAALDPLGWFRPRPPADQCVGRAALERATARGEAGLTDFLSACANGPLVGEGRQLLDKMIDAREVRAAEEAGNDLAKLNAYLATCRRCADRPRVEARLAVVAERRQFEQAGGDAARLEQYIKQCVACVAKAEAETRLAAIRTAEAQRLREEQQRRDQERQKQAASPPALPTSPPAPPPSAPTPPNAGGQFPDLDQAIRASPNDPRAFIKRGNAYQAKGEHDLAIQDFDQAIRLNPNDAAPFNSRGYAYASKRDHDRAIADYDQAIRLDPRFALAFNNRGLALAARREHDRAIADYDESIKLNSNRFAAFYNRGNAFRLRHDLDRAIQDYDQAIRLNPAYPEAFIGRGLALAEKREHDRAIADLDQAIRLDPNDPEAFYGRGIAFQKKGQRDRAIADLRKALTLKVSDTTKQNAERTLRELGATP